MGGLASSTKGVVDVCTGAAAGGTLVPSLEALGQILGESANKTIMRLLARTSGQVLSGSGKSSFNCNLITSKKTPNNPKKGLTSSLD